MNGGGVSGGGPPQRFQIPLTRVASHASVARVHTPPRKLHVPSGRPQSPHLLSPSTMSSQSFPSHAAPLQQLSLTPRPPSPKPLRTVDVSMVPDDAAGASSWISSWAPTAECSIPPIVVCIALGNVNYAHYEAVRGHGSRADLESVVRSEVQAVLSACGAQPSDVVVDVHVEAGQACTLSLAVDGEAVASGGRPTSTSPSLSGRPMPSVRIVGGDWPTRIVVAIASDSTDGMRWVRLHCLAKLRKWLIDRRVPPLAGSVACLASMLGPYHPDPTITKVLLDGTVLVGDDASARGGMKRVAGIFDLGAGTVEAEQDAGAAETMEQHALPARRQDSANAAQIPPRMLTPMGEAALTPSPAKRFPSHNAESLAPPPAAIAAAPPPPRSMSRHHEDEDDEIHEAVASLPSKQPRNGKSIFTSAQAVSPPTDADRTAQLHQPALLLHASAPRGAAVDVQSHMSVLSVTPNGGGSGHVHVVQPPPPTSPGVGGSPKRRGGSLLLRVSTSPMRTEDYYVVGGEHMSHVDVVLHVPVLVRSWSERTACVDLVRASFLTYREMLEYYARDDVWDLLAGGGGGNADRSKTAQILLECAKHVIVSLDVATHPPDGPEPITTPVITVVVVCSILCESLVERLVLGELRAAVSGERGAAGGTAFRRLLKHMASLMVTTPPHQGSTAALHPSSAQPTLGDLVVSLPASLRRCRLLIGCECIWSPDEPVAQVATATTPPPSQRPSPPHQDASPSPEMTVAVEAQRATHHVPHTTTDAPKQLFDDDDDPTPLPIPSATPTPLRSPSSVVEGNPPHVTLVLVFQSMRLRPLLQAMSWWHTNASGAGKRGNAVGRSPAEQLLRACHFDVMDALQAFCYEPEDCNVRFAAPTILRLMDVASSPPPPMLAAAGDRMGEVGCVRMHATVRPSQGHAENTDAFRSSIVHMCTSASAFAALKDVYGQLCMDEDGADNVVTSAFREGHAVLDLEETTFNGIPMARMVPAVAGVRADVSYATSDGPLYGI